MLRRAPIVIGPLALAALALWLVLSGKIGEIGDALSEASLADLGILSLLVLPLLVVRTEAWRQAIVAAGSTVPRRGVYAAGGLSAIVANFSIYLGAPVRIWALRRFAPDSAPQTGQMLAAEAPLVLLEVTVTVPLAVVSLFVLPISPLLTVGLILAALAAFGGLFWAREPAQRAQMRWARGLDLLASRGRLAATSLLLATNVALQVARIWVALEVLGLDASLPGAAMAFLLFGFFSMLNLGAASSAGAIVVVFGSQGVAAATAVGLLLLATAVIGSVLFAAIFVSIAALTWSRSTSGGATLAPGGTHLRDDAI